MNGRVSKKLGKVDHDAKELLMAFRNDDEIFGVNFDSLYWTTKGWVVLELQKCVNWPARTYNMNFGFHKPGTGQSKYIMHWAAAKKLEGRLFVVYYELAPGSESPRTDATGYGNFQLHQIHDVQRNYEGDLQLVFRDLQLSTFAQVRGWFNSLCEDARRAGLPPL